MPAARTLKGISDRTRAAVAEAAQAEGLGISEWIDRTLAEAAEEALNPKAQAVSREDVAEVVREVLREELAGSRVGGGAVSPAEGVRARMRRRRGL